MANDWQPTTIAEIASSAQNALVGGPFGSDLVSRDYVDHGVPVIRGQNMDERWVGGEFVYVTPEKAESLKANLARPGDIVFTQRGTLGQVALVPEKPFERYLISQSQMKLTVNRERVDPLFLYFVFRSPEKQEYIRQHTIQTGVPHTNLGILRATPILLPPLKEQRAISCILGTLDDKIELNRKMNETLEAIARSLYRSWFMDFDPVRAKTVNRETGLPKSLARLFPNSFEESDLGEIPKGWRVGCVGDISEINLRSLSKTDPLEEIDYVEISEVMRGEVRSVIRYKRGCEPSRARRLLRNGDTVLSTVRPDRGAHFLCLNPPESLIASTGFAVLSPRNGNWGFLYSFLSRREVSLELGRLADGGAYPAVRPDVITDMKLVYPLESGIVNAYERFVRPLFLRMETGRREVKTLAALRDTLLPTLVSGELRIKDALIVGRAASSSLENIGSRRLV